MFERLFSCPLAQARHRDGPLAGERRRYLAHCDDLRMSRRTLRLVAKYTLAIAGALQLADRPGDLITRSEIEAEADRHKLGAGSRLQRIGHATRWLRFLGRLAVPAVAPRPCADHVARFKEYMHRERGLSPFTIATNGRTIQAFLAQIDETGLTLRALTAAQANDLLARKVHEHGYARTTVRTWASALRPFLRFAEVQGWCRPGLADTIRTPRRYSDAGLPLGPSWDDVQRLLAAAKGDDPKDVRDRAILMLLAVYGLRAGEAAGLRLDDFDWERGVLSVARGKRGQPRTYPLCRPAGDAVLRYLREVRPRSERREVFLTLVAPFTPLTAGGLQSAVRARLHALGLTLPHYGPHALRHACASHLLARGLSLAEIGDHLGHRHPDATRVYAKVDLAGLRAVADFDLGSPL